MTVRLSRRALKDVEDIRAYTLERWGSDQWLSYFAGLSAAMDRIADDPTCGRPREVFLRNMRSLPHEKHLIFFLPVRIGAGRAAVLRIVHQSRNLSALAYADDLDG